MQTTTNRKTNLPDNNDFNLTFILKQNKNKCSVCCFKWVFQNLVFKKELPGSMSTFGDSSTTNNSKLPKLLIRALLHVTPHTCKHMNNCPVFSLKLLINISLSINIATKFMEGIASNWGYRLYSYNTFVFTIPSRQSYNFQNWTVKKLQGSCMYRIF